MGFDVVRFTESIPPVRLPGGVSASVFEERVAAVRAMLSEKNLDVGFAYGNELKPGDTGWLTGYDPHLEDTACIVGQKKLIVLGGPEGAAYAREMMKAGEYRNVMELKIPEEDYPGAVFDSIGDLLREACGGKVNRIGLLSLKSFVPAGLTELMEESVGAQLVDATDFLLHAKYHKDEQELRIMEAAATISTWAMKAMLAALRPGVREIELAACADYVMKTLGADGRPGVHTLVNSGCRVSNVLGRASGKLIEDGDLVLLGLSARYEGLASSVSRTTYAGSPSSNQQELLEHGATAYERSAEKIGYGLPMSGPDIASRSYLDGVGLHQMYSAVHGIGWTEAMEGFGAATQYSHGTFPSGIALMLDVGVFGCQFRSLEPQHVGMRMEDPYLIDADGRLRKLTDLPVRVWKERA
jgi:Xaa-Pro aminopeptidase